MAFSIRNIFQKGASQENAPGGAAQNGLGDFQGFGGAAAAVASPPASGKAEAGIGFGSSIFKVRDQEEDMQGQPVSSRPGGSPFSPFGAPDSVSLTVGDLLPRLPPELVRGGGVANDQPVAISPQALEAALADGSLAVPVFEVYRVCPVLFQVPISPQDPRMVQLPQNKLVALMTNRGGIAQQPQASPFGAAPTGAGSPFTISQPSAEGPQNSPTGGLRPAGALPPRRPAGVPPAMAVAPSEYTPAALQLPGQDAANALGAAVSPFSFQPAAGSPFAQQGPGPAASPFSAGAPSPFTGGAPSAQPPYHQGLSSMTSLLSSQSSPVTDPELGGDPGAAAPASPYGMPHAAASPFAPSAHSPQPFAGQPSPFAQSPMGGSPFAAQPQGSPFAAQPQAGASPFAEGPSSSGGSPFGAPPPLGASPFASQSPGGSPFSATPASEVPRVSQPPPLPGGSPFASQPGGASPFAADPAGASPFASQPAGASPFASQPAGASPFASQPAGASPFASQPAGASPFAAQPAGASPFASQPADEPPSAPQAEGASLFTPLPSGASPFAMPAASASPFSSQPSPMASPFAAPAAEAPRFVPASVASFEPTPRQGMGEQGKLGAVPFSSPPAAPTPLPTFSLPPLSSGSTRPMPGPSSYKHDENVDISLAAVLKGQSPTDLGFDPNFIPAWINTKLPSGLIREQLPSGQVLLDLGQIIDGTEATFRMVIAHGKREYKVRVPANEIFHLLPPVAGNVVEQAPAPLTSFLPAMPEPPAPVAVAAPVAPTPTPCIAIPTPAPVPSGPPAASSIIQPIGFQLPFSSPMPARAPEPPAPEQISVPAAPESRPLGQAKVQPMVSFDPFASNVGDWGGVTQTAYFEPNRAGDVPEGLGSEQLFSPAPPSPAPTSSPVAAPSPFPPAPLAPVPQAPILPRPVEDNPFMAVPVPAPALKAAPAPSAFAPAQVAAPAHAVAAPVMPKGPSISLGAVTGDKEQMLLRALLGAADRLTPDAVVELASRLPGVLAAVAVMGNTTITHGGADKPAQDFQSHAVDTARSMQSLASLIGFEGAETLSITSGDRLITFSFADALAFGVLHADREPASGLRDKITLIGRELAAMISRS